MSTARRLTTAALLVTCGSLLAPAVANAATPAGPRLLSVGDLPTQKQFSRLAETPVIKGLRSQDYCELRALPKKKTVHRAFYNDDLGRYVFQYAVRMPSESAAKGVTANLRTCFSKAYADTQPKAEGLGKVTYISYGKFGTGSELTAGDIRARDSKGMPDSDFQWAVGRDGRDVTLLTFPMEDGAKPSKDGWVSLAKKAVNRLS